MNYQDMLQDLTESYLKSLFSEASGSLDPHFDSFAPFGELGVDSFQVLKIIKRLEADFGSLPKSLLFEHFNINDLAGYFVGKHEPVLSAKFAKELHRTDSSVHTNGHHQTASEAPHHASPPAPTRTGSASPKADPIRILEKDVYRHPELQELVQMLFERYKLEGSISRGTRKIAPYLFIGCAKRGYFNYSRSKNIVLVYGYTGPQDYLPELLEEIYGYCVDKNLQLNIFAAEEIPSIRGVAFSATPFGVLQRVSNLKQFNIEGGAMRRLRYQVAKFQKAGACKTLEYVCGSNEKTDKEIGEVIDQWCATRTMVNPLVHDVKREILAGSVAPEHRLFLTYLDEVLENVILITAMSAEENGYLMDLEFYRADMPLGGLEFAIVQIIATLAQEGCDVLSLGGTYGCKIQPSANADREIDKILDELRERNVFNDQGNLQFKNKFRPDSKTIFLCRPAGSGNPDNVIDIIMMIADPEKMQTSDEESNDIETAPHEAPEFVAEPVQYQSTLSKPAQKSCESLVIEGNERSCTLAKFGFNPLNIPNDLVEFDLKTDSWAQLRMSSIEAQMSHLHARLQQPAAANESVRAVFPFAHFVFAASGEEAEHIFFKAWPKKGVVLENLLFPSTIFHQIDNGFTAKELPHPAVFDLNSQEKYKGNMDWEALRAQLAQDPSAIAFVVIEVGNNAAGGYPVAIQHLRDVKTLLGEYSVPLVIDGTRVVENAQFLIEHENEYAGKSIWTVVREVLSHADVVIGSLTKDFCVNKGGIIATNDLKLFHRLQELVQEDRNGIDLIDKKMIALSLQERKQIEAKVLRRMQNVRRIWRESKEHNIPVVQPAGGHCILIDVKQIPEFKGFAHPVGSFLAWMYLNTGIRAAAHSVGMQKHTPINDLVRLAIPVGLRREQVDNIIERLIRAFDKKINIPEIALESSTPQPLGAVYANYKLVRYHDVSKTVGTAASSAVAAANSSLPAGIASASDSPLSPTPVQAVPIPESVTAENGSREAGSKRMAGRSKSSRPQDIAIIGMAGRYPKARNPRDLWENLAQGRDCIEELPSDRYERRLQYGAIERYRGGFIDDVDKFDSLFFNIAPREAELIDPQERLFLEVAWEAVEDAGYYPEILAQEDGSRNIGVFVGAVWAMYQMLGVEGKRAGNQIVTNSFLWSIANRVSYWLNLSGPSLTVDTACSSSLTALYLACEAIYAGECSAAIVGGVNLDLHQAKLEINQAGGALSADGICRSFGKGANGYVAGEGVGAVLLKPLDQAVRDRDNIYGVIKSAVVNHGGRTSGYMVPNPKAQTSLILSALEKAGVEARSVGYIEAHGTGTELGDPIEIAGLSSAFSADNVTNQTCAIGSIKSNIGHLEAAAGIVSVSKILLQMKHGQLVPSLHSAELNEFIDFQHSPFYVVQHLADWKPKEMDGRQLPLRAGISSFGAGGANAHIILESYAPIAGTSEETRSPSDLIFPLSARTEDQLRETAVRLIKFLQQNSVNLNDAAYTLQVGRKSFDYRLAIIARTKDELVEKLASFITGKRPEGVSAGQVQSTESITRLLNRSEKEEFIRLVSASRDPHKLAELWVGGLLADWQGFKTRERATRISLPTYPFADKRHWASDRSPVHRVLPPAPSLHPLIDTNESTFERQVFKKTFNDRDFFIHDHIVSGIPTLPGVAYLELARKAGEIAAGRKVRKIKNIIWVGPIAVQHSTPKEVFIELKPNDASVRFEVFSNDDKGNKILHSQGTLLYATRQEAAAEPEYIDLEGIRTRCARVIDGKSAYPLFKSFGLNLGPSFQVLQEVYKNDTETLGALKLPEFRHDDLESMILQPSLIDGSLQAGVAAQLGDKAGEMVVPYSIGEVEILHPLESACFSYVTMANTDLKEKRPKSRVLKSNVQIVDQAGKVLVKIIESTGVPLREVHKHSERNANADDFSTLYYSYEWQKAPLDVDKAAENNLASIVLFDTGETLRDLFQERLSATGSRSGQIVLVRPGERFQDFGQLYEINPQDKNDFTQLFERLIEKQCTIENICFAWPVDHACPNDEQSLQKALARGIYPFLYLCQSLVKQKLEGKVQLLYLYSEKESESQPHNHAVGGFVNTLRLEHPKLLCKTLEVRQEAFDYETIVEAVVAEFQSGAQDTTAVRYEAQERCIKKLKACDLEEPSTSLAVEGARLKEGGVYLITGGAGGLGLIFAEFLAKECTAKLVLSGRTKLSPQLESRLDGIKKSGAEVIYVPADVSNYGDVKNLVTEAKSHFGQIHGIIHAAGVLRDSLIRNKTPEEMSAVCAPKIFGTLHLDEITKDEKLDFFATFSSLAAVAGNAGQCDYSFANHFMDSFASRRELLRAKGVRSGKTLSLNWSLWADGGMKLDEPTELYFKNTLGIKPLATRTGLEAFVKGLSTRTSQFAVLEGVQEKIETAWGLRKRKPPTAITAASAVGSAANAPVPNNADGDLVAQLQNELSQIVMGLLKLDASDMSADKILLDLGFDSIGLTTFANAVNEKYQLDITPVMFFDYPSVKEIANHLAVEHEGEIRRFFGSSSTHATKSAAPAAQQSSATKQSASQNGTTFAIKKAWNSSALDRDEGPLDFSGAFSPELRFVNMPIAIVGMSGVMPQSEDLEEFWENLKNAKDMITVIPPDRWRWEDYYGDPLKEVNKSNSKWGGFMKEIDKFDPLFFGISPREAQTMDPQQRIFLETVWKAIEDSGQRVSDLSGTRTGLFVGVATNDYIDIMNGLDVALDGYSASGNSHSVLANRVSFLLNLRGPSAPIDTACSSSLVALHRAIESIHTGSCDMAIVGGVQVMLSPAAYISFGMAGMLSSDGKCKTFDKHADGYVRGEGCGAIFLKPLSRAEADGNHIYAVIRATAENHGGRVTTLTAPNSSAQSALLIEAYEKAHVDPTTIGYIECHGTGTSLGDPIEIQALSKAFSELYKKSNQVSAKTPHCGLSSVKTNIGHLETAAGIASLLKVLLAIKHKQIPANIHFEEINPYINLKNTPFYIVDKLTPWEAVTGEDGLPIPRRAGVSSFGFGGANAHIVLEEYAPPKPHDVPPTPGPQLIVLSAKNADRLKAYAQSIHSFLEKSDVGLADLAYTLQVGRDEMPERLALVVSDIADLKLKLGELVAGDGEPEGSYRNNIRSKGAKPESVNAGADGEAFVRTLIEQKELSALAGLWVSGTKIDWVLLHQPNAPRRISIPTYPFVRERYWISAPSGKANGAVKDVASNPPQGDASRTIQKEQNDSSNDAMSRAQTEARLHSLVPVWNLVSLENGGRQITPTSTKVLLLGGEQAQLQWLQRAYPQSWLLDVSPTASIEIIEKKLLGSSFDQLLWIAPDMKCDAAAETSADEPIIGQQEKGVLTVFRTVKALLRLGYAIKKLQWTFLTSRTQRVKENDEIRPAHAGVVGLVGSLAKEYPQWDLKLLDVESLESVSAQECWSLPWDKHGNLQAHRHGEWFQQGLATLKALPLKAPLYRKGGVYVVIGGAGGLGEVWTRYMMEHHQANVVWINRRKYDAAVEKKINSLTRLGRAPLYITADATNLDELKQAYKTILSIHPTIHGVLHSAIVLRDHSVARMEENDFRDALVAKVDVAVNMDKVFGNLALDFMLFFSSIISFFKSPGQANYSAGCTFKDSFAQKLQLQRPYPIRIMNWGYWGDVGIVADESYRKMMEQMGIGSIEPQEGMAVLDSLLNSDIGQMALIKTLNSQAADSLHLSESIDYYPPNASGFAQEVGRQTFTGQVRIKSAACLEKEMPALETQEFVTEILVASLLSVGLASCEVRNGDRPRLSKQAAPYYERWLSTSTSYLQQQGWLAENLSLARESRTLADLWAEWKVKKAVWATTPVVETQIALLEACLSALPAILAGKQRATDVLFPNSSMQLVEGIYRDNAVADYFNEVLGDTLAACIERQLQRDEKQQLRILEIGAGTGGTTTKLLPLLRRFPVAEYCYTDVSRAFLMHAEKHYQPQFPAMTTAIFDISKPLARQAIAAHQYDFVIAANVLHATQNIRETLRNAKAALKNGGVLLLNEISTWSIFNHLTFGLLEGWWLYQDAAVRLSGSPGLASEKWQEMLAEEGFEFIVFPAKEAHQFGQQIIAAASNGWVRQHTTRNLTPQMSASPKRDNSQIRDIDPAAKMARNSQSRPSHELAEQTSKDYVRQIITEKLSEALRMDAGQIPNDAPFAEFGVDSIIGVNLVRAINEALHIELETAKLFEYTTVNQLAEYIQSGWHGQMLERINELQGIRLNEDSTSQSQNGLNSNETDSRTRSAFLISADRRANIGQDSALHDTGSEPIAIIGMSGRFAESESLDEFWRNLKDGKDLVTKVSRWEPRDCVIGEPAEYGYCQHGSFIESIDQFDPLFFRISRLEAIHMDPQQRLFLEESWKALEDAGYACKSMQAKQCGIYVGCGDSQYGSLFGEQEPPPQAFWGNSESVIPARIAYHLNLQGPAIAVDTACSSSLVAIHLACQGLRSRETEMALAGGVFLQPTPGFYKIANRAGMLSPEGKCHTFDSRASGFVPGEGVGVLVLKRLREALRDGDYIHGVVVGSGINHNGSSNGLIAPNVRAQERLERSIYDRFKINVGTIQVVEAHGTGTLVGDSIEHEAMSRVFREYTDKKQFCAIGSVKTNIGNAATAGGIAGVLKILLALKNRQIPPSLNFQKANPAIDFESSPFYLNRQLKEWQVQDNDVRRAAINSLGFSGTNAHLVVEEAPSIQRDTVQLPGYLVVLSAQTPEQLKQQARNLSDLVARAPDLSMNDLSFSLLAGRMHLRHRLSCLAGSRTELIRYLEGWLKTGKANQISTSEVQEGKERELASLKKFGNQCIQDCRNIVNDASYIDNLAAIADLYIQGYSLNFEAMFSPASRRMPLPTYPFARERYWVDTLDSAHTPEPLEAGSKPEAPANKREAQLVEIWAETLNLPPEKMGLNDSFFELGGNSLLATQLLSKIRSRMGIDLSLMILFENNSLVQLNEFLATEKANTSKNDIPAIVPVDRKQFGKLPLSFAQERVWFFEQLDPDSARYNVFSAIILRGALNIDELEQAFNLIIARHENLRTVFPSQDGEARQLILDELDFKLKRTDLSQYQSEERRRRAQEACQADAARPFDLAQGPLLRVQVIKLADQEHILMLNMHHIVSDGWSLGVLTKELGTILDSLRQGRPPELVPLAIQYADYSVWQRKRLEDDGLLNRQLAYWQQKLSGVPESLDVAADYPRPRIRSFVGTRHEFTLDVQLTAQLKALAERKSGTLFMVLLAAFKVLLHRYSSQQDICVGTLIANRQYAETEDLIGMFANTLALRSQIEPDDTFSSFLSQVKTTCLEAYEHQDTPFEKVVEKLRRQRNMAINPLFQVMVIFLDADMGALAQRFPEFSFGQSDKSEFDLMLVFTEMSGLAWTIEYNTALYREETIERIAAHFTSLCRTIVAAPTSRISDLDYVGEAAMNPDAPPVENGVGKLNDTQVLENLCWQESATDDNYEKVTF